MNNLNSPTGFNCVQFHATLMLSIYTVLVFEVFPRSCMLSGSKSRWRFWGRVQDSRLCVLGDGGGCYSAVQTQSPLYQAHGFFYTRPRLYWHTALPTWTAPCPHIGTNSSKLRAVTYIRAHAKVCLCINFIKLSKHAHCDNLLHLQLNNRN